MVSEFERGIQDCPHCLSRVFILDNGICPRCQRNARDAASITKSALWIYECDKIPEICHKCGTATRRKVRVSYIRAEETPANAVERGSEDLVRKIFMWSLLGGVFAVVRQILGRNNDRQVKTIAIRIPECRDCKAGKVEPISANVSQRSLKIAVDRHFAEALVALREHEPSGNPYESPSQC